MRSVVKVLPAFFPVLLAAGLEISAHAQGSIGPTIVTQPENQSTVSGGSATFSVVANGSTPLRYQWRLNGTNLPRATNAALQISSARIFNGGPYTVAINNSFGAVTSAVAMLVVDPDLVFRIITLDTNGAISIDHASQTGDDRGGIAVSASNVFVTGDGTGNGPATGRFPIDTLTGGFNIGRGYDALVSNLRTETVYSLGNGANLVQYLNSSTLNITSVTSLIEINGQTGQPTGQRINLSGSVPLGTGNNNGVFAGYDRIVIHNGSRVFDISLPSGQVTDLGPMSSFGHNYTENNWAYWGIAEYTGSALNLIFVQNSQNIVRLRVPDRMTSTILSVTGTTWPSDMGSLTFSISRSRWYCHYEGTAFFRTGDEILGTAKGSYATDAGYPSLTLEPLDQISYPGSNITFTAAAMGTAPLNYRWYFNGVPVVGANGPTLTLTNIDPSAAGLYRVEVSNPLGLVPSRSAVLTIYSVPQVVSQPTSHGVLPGTNVTFSVSVNGAPPLSFQWRRNGTPVGNPSGSSFLLLTNTQPGMAGFYSVLVSNRFGTTISSNAELFVAVPQDDGSVFQIASLTTNGARTVEAYDLLSNYGYGPFAVSSNRVFYSSFNESGRFNADDLSGGTAVGRFYPAFVGNLRTEIVYSPGTASGPFTSYGGGVVSALWEIDGATGALGTRRVNLSSTITLPSFNGGNVSFYSGYDRIVVLNGTRAYSIALPSGLVTDLGPMGIVPHGFSLGGAFWGIAEYSGGVTYLVHGRDSQNVARTRVPDGVTSNLVTFPNGLGSYFASMTASIRRSRWYYSYLVDNPTFGFFNCGIGYANATFNINSGPKADHFEWSPVGGVQVLDTPFNVTVMAKNTTNAVVTNYQGSVLLTGPNVPGPGSVGVNPTIVSNFVNGVWSGPITVLGASTGMVLRATDADGLTGVSEVFSVSPSNDLILRISDSVDPVLPGAEVIYTLSITNTGPAPATGVMLTNLLPTNAVFVSYTTAQGSCALNGAVLLCDLGDISMATSVTVILRASALGTLSYTGSLSRGETDPAPGNNRATELTDVRLPALSISDASITEGNSGTNELTFSVRMSPATTNEVSVAYATFNGTASSSAAIPDYVSVSGVLVLPPGSTNGTITIQTRGDTLFEANETLFVSLSSPTNATLARSTATGSILNDDPPPFISISDITVTEGDSGFMNAVFQVRLSTNSGLAVTMNYRTFDGSAMAPDDFTNATGLITFSANTPGLTRNIFVPVRGDTNIEPNELFYAQIFSATNGVITNDIAACTILNNDGGGILHHYTWGPVPSPQGAGASFPVELMAQDIFNNTVTNFGGTVTISAGGGANTDTNIFGDAQFPDNFNADYTLGYAFTPKFDLTVTHFRHYSGSRVSLWNSRGALLATREVAGTDGTWTETALNHPVVLTANEKYILAFYTGGVDRPYYNSNSGETDFNHVTLLEGRLQAGDAFPSQTTPFTGWVVDIRYQVGEGLEPVPISPATAAVFSKGVSSQFLTIGTITTNIVLTASDEEGRIARSSRFDTASGTESDLEVKLAASANAISVGSNLIYTVTVLNRGPIAASGIIMSNELPAGFMFVSASADQGTVTNSGRLVIAQLGGLSRGAEATVTIRASAGSTGWQTNRAEATAAPPDPAPINNRTMVAILVFRDTDGDGIWDDWEQTYGLNPNDPSDASLDPDGDTHNNLDEFYAGTNPTDPASALRILGLDTSATGTRLTFQGVRGKLYRLESKDGVNAVWTLVLVFKIGSSLRVSDIIELNDPRPVAVEARMYRVEALLP